MLKHRGFPGRLPGSDFQFVIRRANMKEGATKITKRERFRDRKHVDRMADAGFMAALAGIEKAAKRQTVRVWIADLDRAYRRLIAEGVAIVPAALRFGASGLGSISLTHKTRLISPETMVPAGVDLSGEAAELLNVTGRI